MLSASIDNSFYVNRYGQRFVAEDGRRDDISYATLAQPYGEWNHISNGHLIENILGGVSWRGQVIADMPNGTTIFMADTIEELAEMMFDNPQYLIDAVAEINAAHAGTAPCPFGRQIFDEPFLQPPFMGGRGTTFIHHTMGGIEINEHTQVVDVNGNIIPGLYAAGEVVGGIHGANRLGGNAITDVIVFGRIAGQTIAGVR
jgi:fumarate reductase flavoprotein subunit